MKQMSDMHGRIIADTTKEERPRERALSFQHWKATWRDRTNFQLWGHSHLQEARLAEASAEGFCWWALCEDWTWALTVDSFSRRWLDIPVTQVLDSHARW